MRIMIAAILLGMSLAVQAAPPSHLVDLDKPGAMEKLKNENPSHFAKVIEEMDKVQAVPVAPSPTQNLRFDVESPDLTGRHIQTSDPAKTRLNIVVDDVAYRITVLYTKTPARLDRAK